MPVKTNTNVTAPVAQMNVRKRNGSLEPVTLQKILKAVTRCANGIAGVDPLQVASKTIGGLYDGATTLELDLLSIKTAASMISPLKPETQARLIVKTTAGISRIFVSKRVSTIGAARNLRDRHNLNSKEAHHEPEIYFEH